MSTAIKPEKTVMERIFNYVKAHPELRATAIQQALELHANSTSSMLAQMENRGMLTTIGKPNSTILSRNGKPLNRPVKHYRAAIDEYELLPPPKKDSKPVKRLPKGSPWANSSEEEQVKLATIRPTITIELEQPQLSDGARHFEPGTTAPVENDHASLLIEPPIAQPSPTFTGTYTAPPGAVLLENATQQQLMAQLAKLQQQEIRRAVEMAIAERFAMAFADAPADYQEATKEKAAVVRALPRYLVVGLLPQQVMAVRSRLDPICDLRFWKDESTEKLRKHAGWADVTVTMTKFISHSTEDVIKPVIKNTDKHLLRANGGVTDLVQQVINHVRHHAHH